MLIELRTQTKKVRDVRQNAYRVPLKKIKHSLKCFPSLAIRRAGASRHNASAAVLGAARPAGPVVHLAVDRARLGLAPSLGSSGIFRTGIPVRDYFMHLFPVERG